jgi:hypothetical protein
MFFNLICLINMLANNSLAGINNLYEGEPRMLNDCMGLATQLDKRAKAANNAAFFMVNL